MFNDSFSNHGRIYLGTNIPLIQNSSLLQIDGSFIWEFALEYIRSINFPNLPSRFQCMFGCQTLENTRQWKDFFTSTGCSKMNIVKLKVNKTFLGDANWFNQKGLYSHFETNKFGNSSFASYCYYSNKYWSGEMTDNPEKELLIQLPCEVIDFVLL